MPSRFGVRARARTLVLAEKGDVASKMWTDI